MVVLTGVEICRLETNIPELSLHLFLKLFPPSASHTFAIKQTNYFTLNYVCYYCKSKWMIFTTFTTQLWSPIKHFLTSKYIHYDISKHQPQLLDGSLMHSYCIKL